ncbi:MAG: molecular chaperone DnaJ [Myxococcales bacterium]|nr:molecular chaperone DnaJ [Myxococcales bacterium]MBL8719325.1 molecular chaperone DnaJ [Myxococcales bacterium]
MAPRDPYDILGVPRHATPEELKAAFRKLASQHHPDKNPNDPGAHDRFKEINAAYQILSDPQRRAAFDRYGHAAEQPGGGGFPGGIHVDAQNLEDLLGSLFGAFGFQKQQNRGDLRKEVTLTFQEAAFGCQRKITYDRAVTCGTCTGSGARTGSKPQSCNACNGRGKVRFTQGLLGLVGERPCSSCQGRGHVVTDPCETCRGVGIVAAEHNLEIGVPPGIEDGATTTVASAGNVTRPGKLPGDLELVFHVEEHPFFKRLKDDVQCAVPISFPAAALGGEVEVPTLEGKAKVRVPPGTQHGTVLRLKGKGIPRRTGGRGDQRVEVLVEVPQHLSEKQRLLLEELAREMGDEVQPQQRTFMEKLKDLFG